VAAEVMYDKVFIPSSNKKSRGINITTVR